MENACWPDEVITEGGAPVFNDVSRLNATPMCAVIQPRCLSDVQDAIRLAASRGVRLVPRGTKHSMGGQSLSPGGLALDMAYINAVAYDPATELVTCGGGATWADVICALNPHGKTPRTLQSYCTFSVGGTVSVNGHGITSDHPLAESVVRFTLVGADAGARVVERGDELFGLVIGGYGLFGVVYDVTLSVDDNKRLSMDVLTLPAGELPPTYGALLAAPDVQMKLARLDITTFDTVDVFVFREDAPTRTVSALPHKPREQTVAGRLMYKWLSGPLREARFALEHQLGIALDWTAVSDRNEMLFESAAPLVRLYSPLVDVDDTFVLQEYFVPHARFGEFLAAAKPTLLGGAAKEEALTLLNITIRYVRRDTLTALPYAREDSWAFVLYFRLRRTREADARLHFYHVALTEVALRLGGSFYLPYRHHYTDLQLAAAYPGLPAFRARREALDPAGRFGNLWSDRYLPRDAPRGAELPAPAAAASPAPLGAALPPLLPALGGVAPARRTGSFRALLADRGARARFFDGFLEEVFSVAPSAAVRRELARVAWDPRLATDLDIYAALKGALERGGGPLAALSKQWRGVKQLSEQKRELTRETVSILARLGKLGAVHDCGF